MSLLQKFQNLFKPKEDLSQALTKLLKPSTQGEFNEAKKNFTQLLQKYPTVIFSMLRQKEQVAAYQPKTDNLLNLLLVFHEQIMNECIAHQLREQPIYWLLRLMDENRESFRLVERMMTEPSTSSFFPQNQSQQQQQVQPTQSKEDQIHDKRKARIEMNQQLDNPDIEIVPAKLNMQSIKPKIFCLIYYSYLQKLSVNIPIYYSSQKLQYPHDEQPDDNKLKYVWIYKIQNIMGLGLKLIECDNPRYNLFQRIVFKDLMYFQRFLKQEITQLMDKYATIPNLDCLSLYEVYQEYVRANTILSSFDNQSTVTLDIPQKEIEEFLTFAVRLKVMNQFQFKKSIKVPTKFNPYQGQEKNNSEKKVNPRATSYFNKENEYLNINDLQYDRQYERQVMEKQYYNKSTEQSVEENEDQIMQPQRVIRVKGLSTFYQ